MNKQEIVEKIKEMTVETFFSGTLFVKQKEVIKLIEQLDEPQAGRWRCFSVLSKRSKKEIER